MEARPISITLDGTNDVTLLARSGAAWSMAGKSIPNAPVFLLRLDR